ncbi:MAG: hypothetical protein A2V70_06880 [Planctomycetes bacterium RBG_13_63_9]|nr:MAG: hypothetical protein A2V70_06880 [Planctomycetes bacterium RBG_13_63_9]
MDDGKPLLRVAQPVEQLPHPLELELLRPIRHGQDPLVVDPPEEIPQRGLSLGSVLVDIGADGDLSSHGAGRPSENPRPILADRWQGQIVHGLSLPQMRLFVPAQTSKRDGAWGI